MNKFMIVPLNVGHGESILVYIHHNNKEFKLLIDGGSYRNSKNSYNEPVFNVEKIKKISINNVLHGIVVSHVDDDHIGGILHIIREWKKLDEKKAFFLIFNDYIDHSISFSQGETLINEIKQLKKKKKINVNLLNSYSNRYISANEWIEKNLCTLPVRIMSISQRKLLPAKKSDRIYITLLTPGIKEINDVMEEWKKDKQRRQDQKKGSANGKIINDSSISFLLEYDNYTILFTGDSSIKLIRNKLNELHEIIERIDYINLCHHGAAENNKGILELIENYDCCSVFASTNSINYPKHPCLFMLYKLIKKYPDIKIYLTNDILKLNDLSEWDLSQIKEFDFIDNADGNVKTIIQNLKEMEFPLDQKTLEKFVKEIKDKLDKSHDDKIKINEKQLITEVCSEINKELSQAQANGRIICITDKIPYITIFNREDKNEK